MKSADMWHGTLGLALIGVFFGTVAFIAYLLYGPPIPYWPLGDAPHATSSEAVIPATAFHVDLSAEEGVLFACASGASLKAVFAGSGVRLALSDGRHISVPQVMSASGARYANPDESFVFWNNGNTASVEENRVATYSLCVTGE